MIPMKTKETIDNYVNKGWRPGGFVEAALASDFIRAIQVCDRENQSALKYIVDYILEFVPHVARGNYESVDAWIEKKKAGAE